METHNIPQGVPAWHAHRRAHRNASDASAMLGCSPYKTRAELLREVKTGLTAEVAPSLQSRFDDGHRTEALGRPLAEAIIGEELYPVVGSLGELSASFDGLTMTEETNWECKRLNNELRAVLPVSGPQGNDAAALPKHYRVQMEQQCLVADAARVLFTAAEFDRDGNLVDARHCWYMPDAALRAEIVAGWQQFAQDLANYSPVEVLAPAVAAPTESLPAVSVRMDGALSVVSNLAEWGVLLRAFIDRIPNLPSTDQEFADTESACKKLKTAEEALEVAENNALASMSSVEEMRRLVADFRGLARSTRLAKEKQVTARKEQIRTEIVTAARAVFDKHIRELNAAIGHAYMPAIVADFAGAIKGKKTVQSLHDACDLEMARAKIAASEAFQRIQVNMGVLREQASDFKFLFADAGQIVNKAADDFQTLVTHRISTHKAEQERKEAETRERIRAEEQAKAERAAREKMEREAEEQRKAMQATAAPLAAAPAAPAPVPAAPRAANVVPMGTRAPVDALPTLALGEISKRLGFMVTGEFLRTLGFEPTKVKAASLYQEAAFPGICDAIVSHITQVRHERLAA